MQITTRIGSRNDLARRAAQFRGRRLPAAAKGTGTVFTKFTNVLFCQHKLLEAAIVRCYILWGYK